MLPPKILLVNDDPATLLAMRSILDDAAGASRYEVMTATSGEQALRAVLRHDFAVILLDAKMPDMDGFATARAIHAHPRSAYVPIIFLTAHFDDELSRLKGYEYGAVDFLLTPIVPQVLRTKVMVFADLTRQRLALEAQARELADINAQLRAQQRAADDKELRIRTVVENVGDGIITLAADGTIESFNLAATRIFGYRADEAIGRNITLLIPPSLRARHEAGMRRFLESGTLQRFDRKDVELPGLHKDGSLLPLEMNITRMEIEGRTLLVGMVRDIANRKRAEAALLAEKERLRVTLNAVGDAIGDAVISADTEQRVTYLNRAAVALTGWQNDEACGKPLSTVFQALDARSGERATDIARLALLTKTGVTAVGDELAVRHRDGMTIPIDTSAAPINDGKGVTIGVVQVFRDVSHARRIAADLQYQASHDPLTGLINRAEFERRLAHAALAARDGQQSHALLYLDLDQFKIVNDSCGHEAGDALLRQLSAVLQRDLRQSDTLARLGGDEFGVLLHGCAPEPALTIAEQLRRTVGEFHFNWDGKTFSVGVSIGLVGFGAEEVTLNDLLRMADSACYVAKDLGRNRIHVYTPEDEELAQRQNEMGWLARIRHALAHQRFVLHVQAMLPLGAGGERQHYEMLLRMCGDDGRLIAPAAFLPAAERYGLMPAIDRWVVAEAFQHLAALAPGQAAATLCSINLSGASLCDPHFIAFLREQFALTGVAPASICFEITESAAITNLRHAAGLMRELKSIGCLLALDDFGKGMSSFSYLKHLPVDFLKIDGGFVKDMVDDPIDRAMVEAINNIGHVMGLRTVAEYVEDDAILEAVRKLGIDFAQGYVIERPRAPAARLPASCDC